MRLKKAWLRSILIGLGLAATAAIAGNGTIAVLDGGGVSRTYSVVTDGSGNFVGRSVICDQVAAANCATVSAGNAVKVDNSGVTQPVSGTVTANLGTIAGVATAAKQPALGTAGTASADVITVQGITSMTPLLATVTATNLSSNTAQINGVTPLMGNGASGTGALRVTIANDSTGILSLTTSSAVIGHIICDSGCGSASSAGYSNSATFTTGTTAYAIADAVGASGAAAAISFTTMGPASTDVMITSSELEIDTTAVISGETSYTLYLYNVTPPSALNDSAAWTLASGDRASFLGAVQLGTPSLPQTGATTLYVRQDNINSQIKLAATPTIFAYVVSNGAFTPTARVYKVTLHTVAMWLFLLFPFPNWMARRRADAMV